MQIRMREAVVSHRGARRRRAGLALIHGQGPVHICRSSRVRMKNEDCQDIGIDATPCQRVLLLTVRHVTAIDRSKGLTWYALQHGEINNIEGPLGLF